MTGGHAESDEDLARSVQHGDRQALERLVRRYVRPVHAVVAAFLTEPEAVEDAAQETFLRALQAIDRYDPRRPFAPWLYQIARNVARNQRAAEDVRRTEPLPDGGTEALEPQPDVAAERSEIRARIEARLLRLPEQRRTAFRLVDVEGMAAEEAGRIMGLAPGTVRSHVHHARRQLREALGEYAGVTKTEGGRSHEQ
ncbi:MAG: sigma-70 family RNA polymerase sigma factor [Gemmatimonadota bacterium]